MRARLVLACCLLGALLAVGEQWVQVGLGPGSAGLDGSGWVQVDLGAGSAGLDGSGWVQRELASFNGPCDDLPATTP